MNRYYWKALRRRSPSVPRTGGDEPAHQLPRRRCAPGRVPRTGGDEPAVAGLARQFHRAERVPRTGGDEPME